MGKVRWAVLAAACFSLGGLATRDAAAADVGLRFDGLMGGELFGASVASAGDVDDDGIGDVAVGAPFASPDGRARAGRVYLFSCIDGALLRRLNGSAPGDQFGFSVAPAGDVNRDGIPDLIVGAPYADIGLHADVGSAFVISGATGAVLRRFDGTQDGELLGFSVAGAGDVNGNGVPDILVGAPGADTAAGISAGSAFVFSGATGATLRRFNGLEPYDALGWSVAGAGDVNGDGLDDVLVGAPGANPGGRFEAGSVFLFSSRDASQLLRLDGAAELDVFGFSVASGGDVDGDGAPDFIVGAPGADGGCPGGYCLNAGMAAIYSSASGARLGVVRGIANNDALGRSVASAGGDVNGDGEPDFIAGAPGVDLDQDNRDIGAAYAFSGTPPPGQTPVYQGTVGSQKVGFSVAGGGDLNGDGLAEVIVGAPSRDVPPPYAPEAHAWAIAALGPSIVINPPPIPGGKFATNNTTVQLLLPVIGAATVEFSETGTEWPIRENYSARRTYTFTPVEGNRTIVARYRRCCAFAGDIIADVSDSIILDLSNPGVILLRPLSGWALRGIVTVMADASDAVSGMARVTFSLDGNPVKTCAAPPYEWVWDTLLSGNGSHILGARAVDMAGNFADATSVTVTVNNLAFTDVSPLQPFWPFIQALVVAGVTSGCQASPPAYCPEYAVTRGEMAKFICKAAGKTELNRATPTFSDVSATHPFYGWIERLADPASWAGNAPTSGCGAGRYCPNLSVTRAQIAKFLCIARGKTQLVRPTPTFSDVPAAHPFYGWIERLADPGSWGGTAPTSGCAASTFCPNLSVTRDQMAKFLVLAFALPH